MKYLLILLFLFSLSSCTPYSIYCEDNDGDSWKLEHTGSCSDVNMKTNYVNSYIIYLSAGGEIILATLLFFVVITSIIVILYKEIKNKIITEEERIKINKITLRVFFIFILLILFATYILPTIIDLYNIIPEENSVIKELQNTMNSLEENIEKLEKFKRNKELSFTKRNKRNKCRHSSEVLEKVCGK